MNQYVSMFKYSHDLGGEFIVQSFLIKGRTLEGQEAITKRWRSIRVKQKSIDIENMDGISMEWWCYIDADAKHLKLSKPDFSSQGHFNYTIDSLQLTMNGILDNDSIEVVLKKTSDGKLILVDRGFHWINEYPFNY